MPYKTLPPGMEIQARAEAALAMKLRTGLTERQYHEQFAALYATIVARKLADLNIQEIRSQ